MMDAADWAATFAAYRASPLFSPDLHPSMDLNEFKRIYWVEWTDRVWAWVLGAAFVAPCAAFAVRCCGNVDNVVCFG